jgi:hypothetical protein
MNHHDRMTFLALTQGSILADFFQVSLSIIAEFRKKPERTPKEH